MYFNDSLLQNSERIMFSLRELYNSFGYKHYHMSKFEEYDLYAGNKDFLVSDNVITFTDTGGKLMALKPDVTLSIIKNDIDEPSVTKKVYYNENVYRVSKGTGSFKEIMQTGIECFGCVNEADVFEVLILASESLRALSENAVLEISDLDIISEIIECMHLPAEKQKKLYQAIGEKNLHEVDLICSDCAVSDEKEKLKKLISLHGNINYIISELDVLLGTMTSYQNFRNILLKLSDSKSSTMFRVDFAVMGDINYYNGIIFKGFLRDIPSAVLSGGQYDRLMKKLGRKSSAVGFAVYTDVLDRLELIDSDDTADDGFVNIALPKGRLGEKIYDMFARAGFECPSILEPNRKLIFENKEKGVRFFWVKPSDVAIYVERGAADIGVAGKDILLEYEPDVYELADLKKGICRMAVAAPDSFVDDPSKTLRVATKFINIAKKYYGSKGRDIDIIHLNGSIEIAPILKLSDVIVDIVETGTTLKENNLSVIETVVPISARLISNKSAYKFKNKQIEIIKNRLTEVSED